MYSLRLLGAFRLTAPDGRRIEVRSKRSIALLGLLATSETGERTRSWIQDKLWGSRELRQAQSSLRRELHMLKRLTDEHDLELLQADARVIRMVLQNVDVDIRNGGVHTSSAEFLEGMDIAGADEFEEWLRHIRHSLPDLVAPAIELEQAPGRVAAAPPAPAAAAMSVAVLPIETMGSPDDEHLGQDVARVMIDALTCHKWLPVVLPELEGRNGHSDARYSLRTEISHRASGRPRIAWTLLETEGSRLLWANSLDMGAIKDEASLGIEIIKLINGVAHAIGHSETYQALTREDHLLDVDALCWRAMYHLFRFDPSSMREARKHIEQALAGNPYAPQVVMIDAIHHVATALLYEELSDPQHLRLRNIALAVINANRSDWRGFLMASIIELMFGETDLALGHARTAIALNRGSAMGHAQLGAAYIADERPEQAIEAFRQALELAPTDWRRSIVLLGLSLALSMVDEFDEALEAFDEAMQLGAHGNPLSFLIKINILIGQGHVAAAARHYLKFAAQTEQDPEDLLGRIFFRGTKFGERFQSSLEQAMKKAEELGPAGESGRQRASSATD